MVELATGIGVYAYPFQLTEAAKKKSSTGVAAHLLSCFYTAEELVGYGRLGNVPN